MADMIYLIIGIVAGLIVGGVIIYLMPYQTLRGKYEQTQMELTEMQARSNELQSALLEEQSKGYQGRQTMLMRQKRLESDLAEASERYAKLEQQYADFKTQGEQQLQAQQQEVTQSHETISRLEQDRIALQDRFAQKGAEWDEERQSLTLLSSQLDDQVQELRRDKTQLSTRLEQQQEVWERERLALQIQMNALEDHLSLQKAQSGSGLSPEDDQRMEQLRAEVEGLRQQRTAWGEERQLFQEQLKRLQAERRSLRTQVAMSSGESTDGAEKETRELRRQLEEARQEHQTLQERLAAQDQLAKQKYSALEAEIEQLMERLLREQQRASQLSR